MAAGRGRGAAARAPTTAYIRMAVLSALLMLAVYTVFAVFRLEREARRPVTGSQAEIDRGLAFVRLKIANSKARLRRSVRL